jgi:hypothetical protein
LNKICIFHSRLEDKGARDVGVRYIVSDGGRVVIEKWVGKISHAELMNHEKEQLNDQSIADEAIVIVDARQAVFPEATLDGAREFANLLNAPDKKAKFSHFALLVSGETWDQAKVLESETEKLGKEIIAFNDLNIACTWLGLDTKKVLKDLESIVI